MTEEDFLSITHNGQLCDSEGGLGLKEFDNVMRDQVPVGPPQLGNLDDVLRPGGRHGKCTFVFPCQPTHDSRIMIQSISCFNNRIEFPKTRI